METLAIFASKKLGNVTDFGYKCRNCNTINRIILEGRELKKMASVLLHSNYMIFIDNKQKGVDWTFSFNCL